MASNVGTVNVNLALGRCKDCQWWGHPSADDNDYRNVKKCISPKVLFASDVVRDGEDRLLAVEGDYHAGKGTDPSHVLEADEAGVMDGSGYMASMFTGPEFGCIHYEGKA